MATTSAIVAKQQPHSNIMATTSANLATRSAREIQYSHNVGTISATTVQLVPSINKQGQ